MLGFIACAVRMCASRFRSFLPLTARVMMNNATAPDAKDGHDNAVLLLKKALPELDEGVPVTAEDGMARVRGGRSGTSTDTERPGGSWRTIGMCGFIGCHSVEKTPAALEQQ